MRSWRSSLRKREEKEKKKEREKILDCVDKITNTTKLSNKHFFRKFGHFFHQISDKFSPSLTNILFSLCTCYYFTQHAAIVACIIKERFRFYKVLRTLPGAFEVTMVISRTTYNSKWRHQQGTRNVITIVLLYYRPLDKLEQQIITA